jgi:sulfide:quinone oxidoreductase
MIRPVTEQAQAARPEVIVAGGGVAGLEALLALHDLAGDRVALTLLAPGPAFIYGPLLVEEPFDLGPAEQHELEPLAEELGVRFVMRSLRSVRADGHTIELDDGSEIGYDMLVVCVGGRSRPAFDLGITFPGPNPLQVDKLLDEAAGHPVSRVAFVVPPGVTWPLPIYELAMMTERRARERDSGVKCVIVTPEQAPLVIFGHQATSALAEMLNARGIEVETASYAHEADGRVVLTPGDRRLEASVIVALPILEGPAIAGLPTDEGGFIPIDQHAQVRDRPDVYAAGDGTNFPIKQGGLGTQQADAAAEDIAARVGADVDPRPFHPILRGKLLTGGESLHMRKDIAGGAGEGVVSADHLWWPPDKVSGRYLTAVLDRREPRGDSLPPSQTVDIEVPLPEDWHEDPTALDPYAPIRGVPPSEGHR